MKGCVFLSLEILAPGEVANGTNVFLFTMLIKLHNIAILSQLSGRRTIPCYRSLALDSKFETAW
jgi:hypothetical protein